MGLRPMTILLTGGSADCLMNSDLVMPMASVISYKEHDDFHLHDTDETKSVSDVDMQEGTKAEVLSGLFLSVSILVLTQTSFKNQVTLVPEYLRYAV